MKKGWKRFWIFCGVTAALGCVCVITGKAMGATQVLTDEYITGFFFQSGNSTDNDISQRFANVRKLDIDTEGLHVHIIPREENDILVQTVNVDSRLKLQVKEEGEELSVETTADHYPWKLLKQTVAGDVTIYVPEYWEFEEADVQVGYGELYVEDLKAGELNLEVGAGTANIDSFTADIAEFTVGAGNITAFGNAENKMDVECGVGELYFTSQGKKTDFNYMIECGIGELNLDEESYSGIAVNKTIHNNASKDMKIQCGVGSVNISFDEAM